MTIRLPVERDAVAPSARRQNSVANGDLSYTYQRFQLDDSSSWNAIYSSILYNDGTNLNNRVRRGEELNNRSKVYFLRFQRGSMSFSPSTWNAIVAPYTRPRLIQRWNAVKWKLSIAFDARREISRTIDRRDIFCSFQRSVVTVNCDVVQCSIFLFPVHENRRPVVRAIASCVVFSDSEQQR